MTDFALLTAVPAGTTNGTPLPNGPTNIKGVVLYVPAAGTISYAVASAQPTSAPTATTVTGNATGGATLVLTESLGPGQNLYITSGGTNCFFRWLPSA